MESVDYKFDFDDIGEYLGRVKVTDYVSGSNSFYVQVAAKDQHFLYTSMSNQLGYIGDLVDIGLAVYTANRIAHHRKGLPCRIRINLPVRCYKLFSQPELVETLHDTLAFYTDDIWDFSFRPRATAGRITEIQGTMFNYEQVQGTTEVALWSGGLDSLAGLWTQIKERPQIRYVLFGTGPNWFIQHKQRQIARAVRTQFRTMIDLIQVPIVLIGVPRSHGRGSQRVRGFMFLLLGAACALLEEQSKLFIYENGVGALNLACREAEVGLDHSRAVHPLALLRMSKLLSQISGSQFSFENPFLFQTKTEMCQVLVEDSAKKLAFSTISCDRRRRQKNRPPQCGACSSCLLRRQALVAAGITDETPYCQASLIKHDDRLHLDAMLYQIDMLRTFLNSTNPWDSLTARYPELVAVTDRIAKEQKVSPSTISDRILALYTRYVDEWDSVRDVLSPRMTSTTMDAV